MRDAISGGDGPRSPGFASDHRHHLDAADLLYAIEMLLAEGTGTCQDDLQG
jgi:hypothetical protein